MATTKKGTADGQPQNNKRIIAADELEVAPRLYRQIARLLDQLEKQDILEDGVTVPQRISALIACGRVMKMFQDLRKGDSNVGAGSAVNRYAAAFAAQTPHDPSWRSQNSRPTNIVEFDSGSDRDEDDIRDELDS